MNRLSVIILTKNEEKNIRECLETVRWADEIIIVDDLSTDRTIEICREYTGKIYPKKLDGFGAQKQFALEQAKGEWVLSVDADERIPRELVEEIRQTLAGTPAHDAYGIWRKSFYLGRWVRHCGWYNPVVRLFRKDKTRFDMKKVHEVVIVSGSTGYLKNSLIHYSYHSIAQHLDKIRLYTFYDAQQLYDDGVRIRPVETVWYIGLKPALAFLRKYIFLRGFLDGWRGLCISFFTGLAVELNYMKLLRLQKENRDLSPDGARYDREKFREFYEKDPRHGALSHDLLQWQYGIIDGRITDPTRHFFYYRSMLPLVKSKIGAGSSILDIGCGMGILGELIAKDARKYVGMDISIERIRQARTRVAGDNCFFVVGNAEHLPFKDSCADTVVSTEVIEHIPDTVSFIGGIARVLSRDGTFILSTPSDLFFENNIDKLYQAQHIYGFSPHKIKSVLRAGGFEEIMVTGTGLATPRVKIPVWLGGDIIKRIYSKLMRVDLKTGYGHPISVKFDAVSSPFLNRVYFRLKRKEPWVATMRLFNFIGSRIPALASIMVVICKKK